MSHLPVGADRLVGEGCGLVAKWASVAPAAGGVVVEVAVLAGQHRGPARLLLLAGLHLCNQLGGNTCQRTATLPTVHYCRNQHSLSTLALQVWQHEPLYQYTDLLTMIVTHGLVLWPIRKVKGKPEMPLHLETTTKYKRYFFQVSSMQALKTWIAVRNSDTRTIASLNLEIKKFIPKAKLER